MRTRSPASAAAWALGAALLLLGTPARATDFSADAGGTVGAEFLLYDIGARGIGLGGAYTAVSDDAYSVYWNPAGLTKVPRFSAGYMHSQYLQDISYQSASFAYRINDISVLAAGWRYMDVGDIKMYDANNVAGGDFRPKHYIGELGWGQAIYDLSDSDMDLSVGAAFRWIHSDLVEHADAWAGDIGIQSRIYVGSKFYDLGFTGQNVGLGQKFVSTRETLPFRMRLGGAMYPLKPLMLTLEWIMAIDDDPAAAAGVEYTMALPRTMKLMFRAGFNSTTARDLGAFSTMSMGMGFKFSDLTMDYAYKPYGALGTNSVHRLSLTYNLPKKTSSRYRER